MITFTRCVFKKWELGSTSCSNSSNKLDLYLTFQMAFYIWLSRWLSSFGSIKLIYFIYVLLDQKVKQQILFSWQKLKTFCFVCFDKAKQTLEKIINVFLLISASDSCLISKLWNVTLIGKQLLKEIILMYCLVCSRNCSYFHYCIVWVIVPWHIFNLARARLQPNLYQEPHLIEV